MTAMHDRRTIIELLNAAFDRTPPPAIRLGQRSVPMFLVTAISGLAFGALLIITLTALAGDDVLVAAGVVPIAATASVLLALVRKRGMGIERWVLLEHLAAGTAAVLGALSIAGEPLVPWLDRVFAGFSVVFCLGRVGCSAAGCCYGHRSSVGIDHGPSHLAPGRRFPVQLVEACCWAMCAALSVLLIAVGPAGLAFGTTALLCGAVRFFLEGLRADERPHVLGLSESRWLAIALAGSGVYVLHRSELVTPAGAWIGGAGGIAAAILWWTSRAWLWRQPEIGRSVVDRLVRFGGGLAARGPDRTVHRDTFGNATVVASWLNTASGFELYVSVSALGPAGFDRAQAQLVFEAVAEGLGIRGATPDVVETAPGQYVTRFARDEVHVVAVPGAPRVVGSDERHDYFSSQAAAGTPGT